MERVSAIDGLYQTCRRKRCMRHRMNRYRTKASRMGAISHTPITQGNFERGAVKTGGESQMVKYFDSPGKLNMTECSTGWHICIANECNRHRGYLHSRSNGLTDEAWYGCSRKS